LVDDRILDPQDRRHGSSSCAPSRTRGRGLRLLARNGQLILERTAPVYEVLRGPAAADPEIASLWEQAKAQRLAGRRELLRVLTGRAPLRRARRSRRSPTSCSPSAALRPVEAGT
jgi:hypothetical protein